jgi:hypothetical protein
VLIEKEKRENGPKMEYQKPISTELRPGDLKDKYCQAAKRLSRLGLDGAQGNRAGTRGGCEIAVEIVKSDAAPLKHPEQVTRC